MKKDTRTNQPASSKDKAQYGGLRKSAAHHGESPPEPLAVKESAPDSTAPESSQTSNEERNRQRENWLENGSLDLRENWLSVCARANTHEVEHFKLVEIVATIKKGRIGVRDKWKGSVDFDLAAHQDQVCRHFAQGVKEAKQLNRLTIKNILETLGLAGEPDAASLVYTQPKLSEKKFVVTHIKLDGEQHVAPPGHHYFQPEAFGKKKAGEAKKQTPGAIFAGLFQPERSVDYLMRSTGLYLLDFDIVPNLAAASKVIRADPNVVLEFISITRTGLKVCVRGPVARTAIEYTEYYERIAVLKSTAWGLQAELDRQTTDCSRLCFLPYDPDLYAKWDALALTAEDLSRVDLTPKTEPPNSTPKKEPTGSAKAKAPKAKTTEQSSAAGLPLDIDWGAVPDSNCKGISLTLCLDAMRYIDPCCDRETWRIVCAALKLGYGDEAFEYFDQWSSHGGADYAGSEACEKLWQGHKREEGTVVKPASILWLAKQNGWQRPGGADDDNDAEPKKSPVIMEHVEDFQRLLPSIKCVGDQWYADENGLWMRVENAIYQPRALNVLPFHLRTSKRATEVMATFQKQQQVPRSRLQNAIVWEDERQQAVLINCRNGLLRVTAEQTQMIEADPKQHCFTGQLAAAYDENADCPLFERILMEAQPDEKLRVLLFWFFGYILYPSCKHRLCLINYGPTRTSKSTIFEYGIGGVLGDGPTKHLTLSDICATTGYSLPGLQHALLNVGGELDADELAQSSRFKLLVGGEPIEVRGIYAHPFTMRDYIVKLVFLTNHLPRFKNGSDAELARMRFVQWSQTPAKPDASLQYRLPAERDGIFSQCMVSALQYVMQGTLPPEDDALVREQFEVSNDPVGVFVKRFCVLEPKAMITKDELHKAYQQFGETNDFSEKLLEQSVFGKMLLARYCGKVRPQRPRTEHGRRVQVYAGIRLTDEYQRTSEPPGVAEEY